MSDYHPYQYHYTAADLRRYLNGEMSSDEMYALEKQALEDPFLADAIEGYNSMSTEAIETDLATLKGQLAEKSAATGESAKVVVMHPPTRRFPWLKLGVAAAVTRRVVICRCSTA
jgi:hypothetical protein